MTRPAVLGPSPRRRFTLFVSLLTRRSLHRAWFPDGNHEGLLAAAWLSENPHRGLAVSARTLYQAIAFSKPPSAPGLPVCCYDSGRRSRCTGKERDTETGLDFFGARYLSSAQGRFTSPDPIFFQASMLNAPQQFNLYAYVRNNPLRFIDPKGEAIQLTGDEEARRKQLEALKSAVGKQAGAYLYDNAVTDKKGNTQHFVGIYTNGPDGKGPAFEKINAAAGSLSSIIGDSKIASLEFVQAGTRVTNPFGRSVVLGSMNDGRSPGLTIPMASGGARVLVLDPPVDPGKLPGSMMGSGVPGSTDTGLLEIHELGHAMTIFQGHGDNQALSNSNAVELENQARKARNPQADQRVFHDPPGGRL